MSTTVDERVVEMRFDNKQFEQNVQTSLSTIDKLKSALKFDGATKGLESVNDAARKCDFSPLSSAVETVKVKFSALEVMAITALSNITNTAINAGERIVSALTIDPIKTGFQEYETQINAVQTILANTSSKGTTLDQVNSALDELNHYADMTIYNFTEMTRNIGTFTAAGVDLDTSVSAIKGIANLAAVSGSTSQQASTAMYQLSQALAAGTVKLQDWNSVVNAGMGGQVFQDALKETAKVHGIAIDEMIEAQGSFRETLSKGWLTSDILTETLAKFTGDLNEDQLRTMGYTDEQIQSIIKMGQTANDAATKVKTFTQLFDTLKEAAQSGWTQSWEIIVGDFEEAKERLTKVSDILSDIINKSSDRRNSILSGAFGSNWSVLTTKLSNAGIEVETFQNKIKELAKSHNVDLDSMIEEEGSFEKAIKKAFNDGTLDKGILKDAIKSLVSDITGATDSTEKMAGEIEEYGEIVNKVINGDFGNGEERIKALTEAGYDYATVQNLINEKLGSSVRHLSSLTDEQLKNADSLAELSDEQLKNKDYTDEQIEAIRDLAKQADEAGSSIDELISDFEKPSGAELIWDSALNILDSITNSLAAVKTAWNDVFHHGMTEDEILKERSEQIYKLIEAINTFTKNLEVTDEVSKNITRTFKGLFAIIDIIVTITGGGLRLAIKALSLVLEAFDMNILDLTANIGDMLVQFRDFVFDNDRLIQGLKYVKSALKTTITVIKKWINYFMSLPIVQKNIERFSDFSHSMFTSVADYVRECSTQFNAFVERVKALDGITLDNIGAIFKDFKDNVLGQLIGKFDDLSVIGTKVTSFSQLICVLKENVKTYFSEVAEDLEGIKTKIFGVVESIREKFSDSIGFGNILSIGIGASIILVAKKISKVMDALAGPFESIADIISNFNAVMKSCSKAINSFALKTKAQALLTVAIAIGILAAALVALTLVDQAKLWSAVGVLSGLALALLLVSAAMTAISKVGGGKSALALIGISAAVLILVGALKQMETLNSDLLLRNLGILGVLAAGLTLFASLVGIFAPEFAGCAVAFIALGVALKLLVSAIQDIDNLNASDIDSSVQILTGALSSLIGMLALFGAGIKFSSAAGILVMVVALKLYISVFDDIAKLDTDQILKGIIKLVPIFGTFALLMLTTQLAGKNAEKAGVGLLAMSAGLLLIAAALKILSGINAYDLEKATWTMSAILVLFAGIIAVSQLAGENAAKAGVGLLAMSAGILILSGAIAVLSYIDPDGLKRALAAIVILETMFATIIAVTYLAKDCKSTLIVISATIGVLAIALGALSMINPENLSTATNAMTKVMGMFSVLIASTYLAKKANGTLIIMVGVVSILAGLLTVLSGLPADSVLAVSTALSVLLLSLSASMLIISYSGTVVPTAYAALLAMTLVVAALAAIIGVLASLNVQGTLEIAEGLSMLLLSLSASCLVLSVVGLTGPAAFVGIAALITLIASISALMAGVGALATYYPDLETFVNKGISLLQAVANGLGSFVGEIVSGFMTSATDDLETVGENLSDFAESASPFFKIVGDIDESAMKGVKTLAETMLILTGAELVKGVTSWLLGNNDMTTFGAQLKPFGEAIMDFATVTTDLDPNVVTNAANAGKAIAEMASALPNTGGKLAWFTGENDMDTLKDQIKPFGEAIMDFATVTTDLDPDVVTNAANAGKAIAELAASLPNTGGKLAWFTGDNDMGTFGAQLKAFGEAIVSYATTISGDQLVSLSSTTTEISRLVDMANGMASIDTSGMSGFSTALIQLGNSGIDAFISNFSNAGSRISTAATNMIDNFITGINTKKPAFLASFVLLTTAALTTITNRYINFMSTGSALMDKFISGMSIKEASARYTVLNIVNGCVTAINNQQEKFRQAGAYMVEGFANGISSNTYLAEARSREMAAAAVSAAKSELNEHSPSRVAYQIGDYFGQGFVNAIGTYGDKAYNASKNMAQSAKDGLNNAIAKVTASMNDNIDTQPTIRPVLDLSSIESQSQQLNALFSRSQALRISTGFSASRSQEIQNEAGTTTPAAGNSYNFVQNNYSPKALSRIEIYRQTRNQFSAMKEVLR